MIALIGDLNFFAPSIAAKVTAIVLAVSNIAKARDVRAFLVFLVHHGNSSDYGCCYLSAAMFTLVFLSARIDNFDLSLTKNAPHHGREII
jgi:hypothetical protein